MNRLITVLGRTSRRFFHCLTFNTVKAVKEVSNFNQMSLTIPKRPTFTSLFSSSKPFPVQRNFHSLVTPPRPSSMPIWSISPNNQKRFYNSQPAPDDKVFDGIKITLAVMGLFSAAAVIFFFLDRRELMIISLFPIVFMALYLLICFITISIGALITYPGPGSLILFILIMISYIYSRIKNR